MCTQRENANMSTRLFEKYPLPWTIKNGTQFYDRGLVGSENVTTTYTIDANGDEIDFNSELFQLGVKEITDSLSKSAKRCFGDISQKLFVLKNTKTGAFYGGATLVRAKQYRSKGQAERRCNRFNYRDGRSAEWKVIEVSLKEKL